MSQQPLRNFLLTYLPEMATLDQQDAFFSRADVSALMSAAETMIGQIKALWPAPDLPVDSNADETSLLTLPTSESFHDPMPAADYTFLVDEDVKEDSAVSNTDLPTLSELPDEAGITLATPITALDSEAATEATSEIHDIVHPTTSPDEPVRFQPTQQPDPPAPQRTILIPNATVGKPYSHTFDFVALGFPPLAEQSLAVDPADGLVYEPTTQTISGKPNTAGEVTYELTYRPKTAELNRPMLRRMVQLLINPDPRSLWKDLPSDPTELYYKPDTDRNSVLSDTVGLFGASVRGRSHAHEGKFRDDDFLLSHLASGWYLLAIADGAGSARYARRGAQIACETLNSYLTTSVMDTEWQKLSELAEQSAKEQPDAVERQVRGQLYDLLGKAAFSAYKAIEAEALTAGSEVKAKDFATTLIAVLAKPISSGWFVGGFGVGDGGVGIYQANEKVTLLNTPDGGEYAGQTRFLTMPEIFNNNFFARFRYTCVPDLTAVVLMTDGVTDPKFQTDNNLEKLEKWDELWSDITQNVPLAADNAPEQLQDWLTFWSPGNHDDRTIAILYPHAHNHSH